MNLLSQRARGKPFLKWAGGKRWLVERYLDVFPRFEGKYFEPFLGGGSVFFSLLPERAVLSDTNARLIECYSAIRDQHADVIDALQIHQEKHCRDYYYETRAQSLSGSAERAAQFLYLNRTCFNGLYRVNKKGQFNVPLGTKTKVIDEDEDFEGLAAALKNVELRTCDFEETLDRARAGDFVFVDPPYTVKHNLNGFLKYNEKIFSWEDQIRLRDAVVRAKERGVTVLLTNAAHWSVVDLYKGIGTSRHLTRASVLSGKSDARGSVDELLVFVDGARNG